MITYWLHKISLGCLDNQGDIIRVYTVNMYKNTQISTSFFLSFTYRAVSGGFLTHQNKCSYDITEIVCRPTIATHWALYHLYNSRIYLNCVYNNRSKLKPCESGPAVGPGSNNPDGPCPFCKNCKDSTCAGSGGPSYYQCARNWQGNTCNGEINIIISIIQRTMTNPWHSIMSSNKSASAFSVSSDVCNIL